LSYSGTIKSARRYAVLYKQLYLWLHIQPLVDVVSVMVWRVLSWGWLSIPIPNSVHARPAH